MYAIRHLQTITLTLVIGLLPTVPLSAQVLYGASNGSGGAGGGRGGGGLSDLYTIDPASGTATMVGPIGFENVTGLAFLPDGRLVASTRGDAVVPPGPSALLIEIDPLTGAGTLIGTIDDFDAGGNCGRMPDITYDPVSDNLFGYADFCDNGFEGLYTVDTVTGAGTPVGPTGFTGGGNGLAAEPGTGTLYATPFDNLSLVIIDPGTGAGTEVPGSVGNVPNRINALDFHPDTGVLFGSLNDGSAGILVTIDTTDGTTTTIGTAVLGLDAIVFERGGPSTVEIPTLNAAGLGLLALLVVASACMVLRQRGG